MSESCLLNKPFMLKPGRVSSDDCETWISAFFNSILRSSHFTWAWNYCSDLVCCMMCIFRAAYFFLGPGSHFWAPFGFSCVLPYFSSVCTYCSLFPRISSALTLPLCLPGSLITSLPNDDSRDINYLCTYTSTREGAVILMEGASYR